MPVKKGKKGKTEEKESRWEAVGIEIKKSIAAVLLIGIAIILLLASFHKAGPVGEITFKGLNVLIGIGYYILPTVALIVALVFLLTDEIKILAPTFVGAFALIASVLASIDLIFPQKAGWLGNVFGTIEIPFGFAAALVIVLMIAIAALLLTINLPIKINLKKLRKEKMDDEGELDIKEPAAPPLVTAATEEGEEKTEENRLKKPAAAKIGAVKLAVFKNYRPPPATLLKSAVEKPAAGDLRANANIIKRTLDSFGIPVEMGEINIGPKVTRYTLKPAEGIKLTRITALNQDLALALAAHPLRIEAPIPGKSLVGIEVPNKVAATVRLGSLTAYPEFSKSGLLTFILGRDINGMPILANIAKMPHLLISGSTGAGKSILIHSLIISLLCKNSPETLRLALIDPKRVELSAYNGIPHLIAPVITSGKKAINAFRWAIQEMEERYEKLLKAGARDIESYNQAISRLNNREIMPYLLIIVDELADLMAAHGREVESAVVRLAQMARATGIHLILATQRPSVDVITGLIKANITSRAALQVASQIDSRTILDIAGAEKLLGGGDMLFISSEFSKPKRIQGAYISEKEIQQIVGYIKQNNKRSPEEPEEETTEITDAPPLKTINFDQFNSTAEEEEDELYQEAVAAVYQAQKASASLLQRRLRIGYARAARLLDMMEEKGLIGPGEGAKPRKIYMEKEPSEAAPPYRRL